MFVGITGRSAEVVERRTCRGVGTSKQSFEDGVPKLELGYEVEGRRTQAGAWVRG